MCISNILNILELINDQLFLVSHISYHLANTVTAPESRIYFQQQITGLKKQTNILLKENEDFKLWFLLTDNGEFAWTVSPSDQDDIIHMSLLLK